METTPEVVVGSDGAPVKISDGKNGTPHQRRRGLCGVAILARHGRRRFFPWRRAEILLDTARFWASRAVAEGDGGRHIRHVIGPDEYHEDVDDNAFTNVMARWNIGRALEAMDLLQRRWPDRAAALREKLALGDEELSDWRDADRAHCDWPRSCYRPL